MLNINAKLTAIEKEIMSSLRKLRSKEKKSNTNFLQFAQKKIEK